MVDKNHFLQFLSNEEADSKVVKMTIILVADDNDENKHLESFKD